MLLYHLWLVRSEILLKDHQKFISLDMTIHINGKLAFGCFLRKCSTGVNES